MSEVEVSNLVEDKDTEFITKPDKTLHISERNEYSLTQRQQKAAELLAAGKNKKEVAEEVGISRQQLWEWGKNAYFRSAVSIIHADLWVENKQRLRGLSGKAIDVIATEIDNGNLKAAVELCKLVGLSNGKIALTQQGKSVGDILEMDATVLIDERFRREEKPRTIEETFLRYSHWRPYYIRGTATISKIRLKVPEDKEEEQSVKQEEEHIQ